MAQPTQEQLNERSTALAAIADTVVLLECSQSVCNEVKLVKPKAPKSKIVALHTCIGLQIKLIRLSPVEHYNTPDRSLKTSPCWLVEKCLERAD